MRPRFQWNLGARWLPLGERTLVMGIVNVTPDSFSDGGMFREAADAVAYGLRLLDEGADILDIGGESTRPGVRVHAGGEEFAAGLAGAVSADEELSRVLPVISGLKARRPNSVLSVDTYKAAVAREAVSAGAEIVNDVSGFRWDDQMAATVGELGCGAVLMHVRGRPDEWRSLPREPRIVDIVRTELASAAAEAVAVGIQPDRLVLDPGFGFGKNFEENYPLLARFHELSALGYPLLAATSRKSFLGKSIAQRRAIVTGVESESVPPAERLYGTVGSCVAAVLKGAHIVRVHDVRPLVEAMAVADDILAAR